MNFDSAPLVLGSLRLDPEVLAIGFAVCLALGFLVFGSRREVAMIAIVAGFAAYAWSI